MKLLQLSLKGVRALPDRDYLGPERSTGAVREVSLITGPASSGKTSLLDVIVAAWAAAGNRQDLLVAAGRLVCPQRGECRIEATWSLSEAERSRAALVGTLHTTVLMLGNGAPRVEANPRLTRLFADCIRDPERGKLEYFPANRRLAPERPRGPSAPPLSDAAEGRLRLTRDLDKYAGLRRLFHDLTLADAARLAQLLDTQGIALRTQQPDALAPFKEAIAALLPDLRLASVELGERATRVWFQRRDGARVELDELSESEQQALLFAVTFRRLGLNHSVILIDTPELHLHPRRVAPFFGRLLELGRDNQIIAATTSAELLATVRPEQVIDLGQG